MKKVYFGSSEASPEGNEPFWKPWGFGGWLLRLVGFLILLFILGVLLSLFKSSRSKDTARTEIPDPIVNPVTPDPGRVPLPGDENFPHDIQNPGRNLPQPGDNNIPPHDEDDIEDDEGRQVVGDRLNVILDAADDQTFNKWADEFKTLYPADDYKVVYYDRMTQLLQIQIPREERNQIMQALPTQINDISFYVFPEGLMGTLGYKPNDLVFDYPETSWYFDPIQAYDAWEITKGSPDVIVAICDSYFDLNHDDLNSNRIVKPYSVMRRNSNVKPAEGCDEISFLHGSMVASQALGNMDNQRGTAGIAPGCKFMPVSMGHEMTNIIVLQGLLYAIYQGASVVNLSVGDYYTDEIKSLSLEEQIQLSKVRCLEEQAVWDYVAELARERNVTIVWAAGNENVFSALDASKRGDASIKVAAVDKDLHKADFSNFGNIEEYDLHESTISAPGVDIIGAKPYNTYEVGPGTSFAAPIVTGAVALMKSLDPTLSTAEIIEILRATGKPIQGDATIGKLLQIKDALMMVKNNFADFDDIMANHEKFVGLWRSTTLLEITTNGQPTGKKCRSYYDITSTEGGTSIIYATDTEKDYTTSLSINWKPNEIVLKEAGNKTNPTDDTYKFVPLTIVCAPDSAHQMKCLATDPNGASTTIYLRKVTHRQD